MNIHFKCTERGRCCRDTKIPLAVAEAVVWLNRGHDVQLLCEASPWPSALNDAPRAAHFKRCSFAVLSGSSPARVVLMLVANVVGRCPNLLPNGLCGVYEDRPLVCRIYPAEINPFVDLRRENKLCPPKAWTSDRPLLKRSGCLTDEITQHNIELSRSADSQDAQLKRRLCVALNIADTALVHKAVLVYSPTPAALLSALTIAMTDTTSPTPTAQWRYISDQPEVLETLAQQGAIALHPRDAEASAFQHLHFKRQAIFNFNAGVEGQVNW